MYLCVNVPDIDYRFSHDEFNIPIRYWLFSTLCSLFNLFDVFNVLSIINVVFVGEGAVISFVVGVFQTVLQKHF